MATENAGPASISLAGQVAIVTGARRGLGRAYALDLAARGASVVVNGTPASEGLDEVVGEIEDAGGTAIASASDVSTPAGGRRVVEDALSSFGRLDVVVNNAGILRTGFFEDLSEDTTDAMFAVHLKSVFNVTQPAFPVMREQGYGRIVNTTSNTAFGMSGLASYAAAKAGIIGLTKSLALEGAADGIRVNAVMPNAATPAMVNDPIPGFEDDTRFVEAFGAVSDRFDVALVAPLVAFLASRECPFSGEILSALGGRYARVFYGVSSGWLSPPDAPVSAEDIAAHLPEVMDAQEFLVPEKIRDEYEAVAKRLRTRGTAP